MLSPAAAHGRFVWFELMTTDVPAAIAFYGAVVGWTTEPFRDSEPGKEPYQMWKTPAGSMIGGILTLPEAAKQMGAPPHWMGNLVVPSVDEAVAGLKAHGGQLYMPAFDIPQVGRVAVVADPAGAALALFQPMGDAPGHDGAPTHGDVSWAELSSADPDAAWAFYADVAGWRKTEYMDMGPMGTYQMFGPPSGGTIGGMMRLPPGVPVSNWLYYFYVTDLDAAIARAQAHGGALLNGPMQIPGGDRVAQLRDPQGAFFALHGK